MLFYTTFARRTFTVSLNELFENYTGRRTHVYSGRMTRLKYPPCLILVRMFEKKDREVSSLTTFSSIFASLSIFSKQMSLQLFFWRIPLQCKEDIDTFWILRTEMSFMPDVSSLMPEKIILMSNECTRNE